MDAIRHTHHKERDMSRSQGQIAIAQCELCTMDFVVLVSEQKRGNGRFCSKRCASKWSNREKPRNFRRIPLETRFWAKVVKSDGCWLWTGCRSVKAGTGQLGYGQIRVGGMQSLRATTAHRVSWMLAHGPVPEGCDICHRCDNPACVRPDHLFLGSRQDNVKDMHGKKRWPASSIRLPVSLVPRLIKLAGGDERIMRTYTLHLLERAVATEEALLNPPDP
jgi:hypothetical protein